MLQEGTTGIIDLPEDDPIAVEVLIKHVYGFEYKSPDQSGEVDESHQAHNAMEFHVKAYAIGEKYEAPALKKFALSEFGELVMENSSDRSFLRIVAAIYQSSPAEDRGLRDLAVDAVVAHQKALLSDDNNAWEIVMNLSDFAVDILPKLGQRQPPKQDPIPIKTYYCPDCGIVLCFDMESFNSGSYAYCPGCGARSYHWRNYAVRENEVSLPLV